MYRTYRYIDAIIKFVLILQGFRMLILMKDINMIK